MLYVEDFPDSFEPFNLQRNVSLMREIDAKFQEILKKLDDYYEKFKRQMDGTQERWVLHCVQRALICRQELGDEKIQIVSQRVELVENRTRQVDCHVELFEAHQDISDSTSGGKAGQNKSKSEAITQADKPNNKRSQRQRNNENRENASNNHDHEDITSGTPKEEKAKTLKKNRSKAKAEREASPTDLPSTPTSQHTVCAIRSPMER
ncbi:inhibitor of growth protein 1 isoform X1 [Sigmodon hispidus]